LRKLPYLYELREKIRNLNFQKQINKHKLSDAVYIEPNYIARKTSTRTIPVIHDLSHIHYPEYHPKERVSFLNKNLPETIRKAGHIITVSEFVRKEIIRMLGVSPDRVTAVLNGVGKRFRHYSKDEVSPILSGYGLKYKKYILSVATLEPRKNIQGLITAYMNLNDTLQKDYPLVLAGASGWGNSELHKNIKTLVKQGKIFDIGYILDDILPVIYSGASAFVYVSHYEGFGLPVLEAMASGVPVITSKMTSMSEITGNAALLVDPNDQQDITGAMKMLLENEKSALKFSRLGLDRSKQFSWQRASTEILKVIQGVST